MEDKKPLNNPNGANQHVPDPRQTLFLSNYLDPKSDTFSNGLQSALKAGYSQEYAENILALLPEWLSEALGDIRLLHKAEKNLNKVMDLDLEADKVIGSGDNAEVVKVLDPALIGQVAKVSMFVAERLGKSKYSTRSELTGPNGTELIPDKQSKEKADAALDSYLKKDKNGSDKGNTRQGES